MDAKETSRFFKAIGVLKEEALKRLLPEFVQAYVHTTEHGACIRLHRIQDLYDALSGESDSNQSIVVRREVEEFVATLPK